MCFFIRIEQWQQQNASAGVDPNAWRSSDDIWAPGNDDVGVVCSNQACRDAHRNTDPEHDMEYTASNPDGNGNGVSGEIFYMKLPSYNGDYDSRTESTGSDPDNQFEECPE